MSKRRSWRQVKWFVRDKPKRKPVPKELAALRQIQQELRKYDRYTVIRKDSNGDYFLEPVPPPPKHDAMFKATKTGHVQN